MNTSKHLATKSAQEFKVELRGAYQGNYRALIICCENGESETFVFTDTKQPVHINNQDIINLVTETISTPNV